MPDSLEFPGMRRAIVPLMRAWDAVVQEFVTDWRPRFPAVIGTLYQLPKPSAVLGGIKPLCVSGRSLQMEYLPPGKVGASNLPLLAHCIGSQDECTFARPHQNSYTAHLSLRREQEQFQSNALVNNRNGGLTSWASKQLLSAKD